MFVLYLVWWHFLPPFILIGLREYLVFRYYIISNRAIVVIGSGKPAGRIFPFTVHDFGQVHE